VAAIINTVKTIKDDYIHDVTARGAQNVVNISTILTEEIQSIQPQIESLRDQLPLAEQETQVLQQKYKTIRLKPQQATLLFMKTPPQDDDPIIAQFKSVQWQWELNGENINRVDSYPRQTILHNYCQYGINSTPLEIFRYLIETKGCDINRLDKDNNTPVHFALRYFVPKNGSDINIITYLLIQVRIWNTKCDDSLLHSACENINSLPLDIFVYLIETNGCDVNAKDNNKNTAIHIALAKFQPEKGGDVRALLYLFNQNGVDVNIKDQFGRTLLHWACQYINTIPLDTFKRLIEVKGADINVQDNNRNTPLHNAIGKFQPGCDVTILTYLLDQNGVNVNINDAFGRTLLHKACHNISLIPLHIFKYLIQVKHADVNAQDNNHDTPLHDAFRNFKSTSKNSNEGDIIGYLLSQDNVNVNIKGDFGRTLLHLACSNNCLVSFDMFRYIIETKKGQIGSDYYDWTPLHSLMDNFSHKSDLHMSQIAQYLIQHGVELNQSNWDQQTALDMFSPCTLTLNYPLTRHVFTRNGAK
jgi:ankyrin repeat protein